MTPEVRQLIDDWRSAGDGRYRDQCERRLMARGYTLIVGDGIGGERAMTEDELVEEFRAVVFDTETRVRVYRDKSARQRNA